MKKLSHVQRLAILALVMGAAYMLGAGCSSAQQAQERQDLINAGPKVLHIAQDQYSCIKGALDAGEKDAKAILGRCLPELVVDVAEASVSVSADAGAK